MRNIIYIIYDLTQYLKGEDDQKRLATAMRVDHKIKGFALSFNFKLVKNCSKTMHS